MERQLSNPADQNDLAIAGQILEESPSIALRVVGDGTDWTVSFITNNVSKYGYASEDFLAGRVTWQGIVHPEDLPGLDMSIEDYRKRGIPTYSNIYRVLAADGTEMWVADHSTDVYGPDGTVQYSDCIISDYSETRKQLDQIEDFYRQQRVMKEILLCLRDVDVDGAFNTILDSTGVYLDVSRVVLFEDEPDHKKTNIIFEWCNTGIPSLGSASIDYDKDFSEIDEELHRQGYSLIPYGEIPEHSRAEFDREGVIASAIFAVYVEQERFGFICFDECVKQRQWPADTVRFLQTIANLVAPFVLRKRNIDMMNRFHGHL